MAAPDDVEKSPPDYKGGSYEINPTKSEEDGTPRRESSAVDREVLTGEIFDDRYESTQRGLKSRHAQMIGKYRHASCLKHHKQLLTQQSSRWNYRYRSFRRIWTDTCSRRSSLHPRSLHLHVLPHLVHCYWHDRTLSLDSNKRLLYEHVRMAICEPQPRLCDGLAVLLQLGDLGPI